MNPASVTYGDVCNLFDTEENCIRILFDLKWPAGFCCPRCQHPRAYTISTRRLPLYECRHCGAQISLTTGTILEGSRTPLRLWLRAIFLHGRPEGVNALQLAHMLGVTYKTAWLICHKIRHGMSHQDSQELLRDLVRVSDAKLFNRMTASLAWHTQEQSVIVGSSENDQGEIQRIKMKKQNKQALHSRYASPATVPFISENVHPDAVADTIVTRRYGPIRNPAHVRIAREAEWKIARMFRAIGPKHLQAYLDQFCYVWNRRKQAMFEELLRICATTATITYPELTGRAGNGSRIVPGIALPAIAS